MSVKQADDGARLDAVATTPAMRTVEVKIEIPNLPPLHPRARKAVTTMKTASKPKKYGAAICIIALAAFGGYQLLTDNLSRSLVGGDASAAARLKKGNPEYNTILPANKTIEQLGGWTRISPPDRNPVFAYVDRVGNATLSVSQQPLPDNLKGDTTTQVTELAQGFKATEKFSSGSTTVHIGSSADGPQSIIFSKNNLLILIKSSARLDNNLWAEYVNSLR